MGSVNKLIWRTNRTVSRDRKLGRADPWGINRQLSCQRETPRRASPDTSSHIIYVYVCTCSKWPAIYSARESSEHENDMKLLFVYKIIRFILCNLLLEVLLVLGVMMEKRKRKKYFIAL